MRAKLYHTINWFLENLMEAEMNKTKVTTNNPFLLVRLRKRNIETL